MTEEKWNHLCWELFAHQLGRVTAYKRLVHAEGRSPANFRSWKDTPAVPQALFKRANLYCAGLPKPRVVYETSGTTTGQTGRQNLLDTMLYKAVTVEGARRAGLFQAAPQLHFLAPSPAEAPHSSLSAMFGFWREALGQKGERFWARRDGFHFAGLRDALEKLVRARKPVGLAGTAFAFVHLLDAWAGRPPLRLPRGSWLLETGGFKGRSREISKAELYAQLARAFAVRDDAIWNEYGMSELSSQAYARGTSGLHQTPPWARVLIIDPATGREVRPGEKGLVRWLDLANTDSVFALQTLDLAEHTADGFRLIGRLPRTEPRGCSLSAEDLVARAS
jgi:hypothetical protein